MSEYAIIKLGRTNQYNSDGGYVTKATDTGSHIELTIKNPGNTQKFEVRLKKYGNISNYTRDPVAQGEGDYIERLFEKMQKRNEALMEI